MSEPKFELSKLNQPLSFSATLDAETTSELARFLNEQDKEYMDALFAGKTTLNLRRDGKYITLMPINQMMIAKILMEYFTIGNSYTYELTRDKTAFEIGTIDLDDFVEWDESQIADLSEFIIIRLKEGCMNDESTTDAE